MMKRNNWIGLIIFIFFLVSEWPHIHPVEAFVLFSILFLIPLSFAFIGMFQRSGQKFWLAKWVEWAYPFAAISAMLAFLFDSLLLAGIWFLYTGLVALLGFRRLMERGLKPIGETSIDFGLLYLFLGGFWFFAYIAEWNIMGFSGLIVLLTAIHFHYSAYFLPIFAGLLNRKIIDWPMTIIIMLSPITVAVGITYSTAFELVAVILYFLALVRYGYRVWTTSFEKKWAKRLLVFSGTVLIITITFSVLYATGTFRGRVILSIDEMIWIHGAVNAVAVILIGLLGWHLESPKLRGNHFGKPMSKVKGTWLIGGDFLAKSELTGKEKYVGLVDKMAELTSSDFDVNKLSSSIIDFYEQTVDYELKARITWSKWFIPFAYIYQFISRHVQQVHLGIQKDWQRMSGDIVGIDSLKDGRNKVRAWVRQNESGETIFVALYSLHSHQGQTYMNIALPLPKGNMTGILKPLNAGANLILTSRSYQDGNGDEGIYFRTRFITIRLPLAETFTLQETSIGTLQAHHQMWIYGIPFLQIQYNIAKQT
ncbi:YndJ family protein [Neobacillus sp. D3-1R]|uniref:YndJ family protein n=1 Tax=Neobacillus sp. D3-1R TaxID=3445778 RepID=UPI003F9FA248